MKNLIEENALIEAVIAYERGDHATAAALWRVLAEQGDAVAQYNLGVANAEAIGVTRDDGEAVKWYRRAAEQGNADAQANLGFMYQKGRGVAQDYGEALKWFRRGVEQGHAIAQYNLGHMYDKGRGVSRDFGEAASGFGLLVNKETLTPSINSDSCTQRGLVSLKTMAKL